MKYVGNRWFSPNDSLALYYYSFLKSLCIVWIYIILSRRDSTSFKLKYELLRLELLLLQWMWYFLGRCEIFLFGVSSPPTDQKLVTGPSLILAWADPFFGGFSGSTFWEGPIYAWVLWGSPMVWLDFLRFGPGTDSSF